jgi:hypothetical protein
LLGKILSSYLRGDERDIGDHQNYRELLGNCWSKGKYSSPPIGYFMGMRDNIEEC